MRRAHARPRHRHGLPAADACWTNCRRRRASASTARRRRWRWRATTPLRLGLAGRARVRWPATGARCAGRALRHHRRQSALHPERRDRTAWSPRSRATSRAWRSTAAPTGSTPIARSCPACLAGWRADGVAVLEHGAGQDGAVASLVDRGGPGGARPSSRPRRTCPLSGRRAQVRGQATEKTAWNAVERSLRSISRTPALQGDVPSGEISQGSAQAGVLRPQQLISN